MSQPLPFYPPSHRSLNFSKTQTHTIWMRSSWLLAFSSILYDLRLISRFRYLCESVRSVSSVLRFDFSASMSVYQRQKLIIWVDGYGQFLLHPGPWIFSGDAPCHRSGSCDRRNHHREPAARYQEVCPDWSFLGCGTHRNDLSGRRGHHSLRLGDSTAGGAQHGTLGGVHADSPGLHESAQLPALYADSRRRARSCSCAFPYG